MNYSADRPIYKEEQDLLGRSFFSKQLGKAIYEYDGKDGLVVGLFGKWGTGKTSVINLAINEINDLVDDKENEPIIMRFSPWNYSDKDNLISLFFQSLKHKINLQDNEVIKKKVGKALSDYAGAFDALSLVPIVGSGAAAVFKTLAQAQGANLMQEANLDKTREKLEKALIEAKKKIIIVIDDIDRLTNSQIRDVFQLVKQVADFPNIIYILAMDREVVRSALSEVHNIDGNEYLEKIIQVPFEIPELRKPKLHNILFTKLDQIIKDIPGEVVWDKYYWNNVFSNCIAPYINTLRDVNRVINTFLFRYEMVYQETSFEDMLGITTLEVLVPELYRWISSNKDAVCGGPMHGFLVNGSNKPDYRQLYYDEFKSLGIDPDIALRCVSTMFPVFAKDVCEVQYSYQSKSDIRGMMRVADEGRFELYFMFDLDDIKVSRMIISACIYKLEKDQLCILIKKINEQGNIIYFIEEIRALVDKIPYERLSLVLSVVLDLLGEFSGEYPRGIFTISASDLAEHLVNDMIRMLKTEDEIYEVVRSAVIDTNKTGLGKVARIINRIELAYGRLAGETEDKHNQIISLEHLIEIETIYLERIQDIVNTEPIFNIIDFKYAFYLWECFDKDGVVDYLNELFKDEVNKLKFICAIADRWVGSNGSAWSFSTKNYSEYISQDEIYNLIQDFDKNKLDVFTETEQIQLASFVLNYHKHETDHVYEQDALELVNKWKTGK